MSRYGDLAFRSHRSLARRVRGLELRARRGIRYPVRVECRVCGWTGPSFAPSIRPRRANRICPSCHSSERYRALDLFFGSLGDVAPGTRLLEVAPVRTVEKAARDLGFEYTSVDLRSATAQVNGDLCSLPFPDDTFDLVVCFHVLEHIPEDRAAVAELARVVGRGGKAVVVVPREADRPQTFEVPGADPGDYERLYGQSDHVRIYGADVSTRWRECGVEVVEQEWTELFGAEVSRRAALAGDDDRFWILAEATAP